MYVVHGFRQPTVRRVARGNRWMIPVKRAEVSAPASSLRHLFALRADAFRVDMRRLAAGFALNGYVAWPVDIEVQDGAAGSARQHSPSGDDKRMSGPRIVRNHDLASFRVDGPSRHHSLLRLGAAFRSAHQYCTAHASLNVPPHCNFYHDVAHSGLICEAPYAASAKSSAQKCEADYAETREMRRNRPDRAWHGRC